MKNMSYIDLGQIYDHISAMCGISDPSEACRTILAFCQRELSKLSYSASEPGVEDDSLSPPYHEMNRGD